MAARGFFSLISLVLVAGGLLFMFFVLLPGAVNGSPVNSWYFLQVDTSSIPGAQSLSRWTYWNICGVDGNGHNVCGSVYPAFPLDPPSGWNFNTNTNIPSDFIGSSYYFLMTRFMFAFMLIALFFGVFALFTGALALCTRLGAYLSGLLTTIAFVFQAVNAALMTAAHIKARDAFNRNNQAANIGTYAFGFQWAAFACFFLATLFFCMGGSSRKDGDYSRSRFGGRRSKSTRSRGSFINGHKDYA